MLLNWLVPQSGGLPFKYWLFHKMIFFQTSSLPRRMLKKFWFTEFRQADPVLFFLTFQVLKYFQTSTINPWRLWNSSFIHRPNLLPLEGGIWCNNSLLVLAVFIVEHWLWIEDKRLIGIFDTEPGWYKIELIVLQCLPSTHIWILRPYRARQTLWCRISAGTYQDINDIQVFRTGS